MRRRLLLILVAATLVTVVPATAASAHGEKSQEGFLRMRTVGWTDVNFTRDTVMQGEMVTVTGTLIGPGAWITVKENPAGFVNQATLLGGKTINLENYQLPFIWIWLTLTFVIGMVWMIYWTVPKRTIPHLAVTSQIPLNTDGAQYGLVTKKDHRNSTIMMLATVVLLGAGWIYQLANFPVKIPQQIIQFAPAQIARPAPFVALEAGTGKAVYDADKKLVTLQVNATNNGKVPAQLTQFAVADLTW